MPYFLNSFKKHDVSEFPGVLVPLQQAQHRGSVSSRRFSLKPTPQTKDEKDEKSLRTGSISPVRDGSTTGLTLETLKAEIEADLAASDSKSAYDRTSHGT